MTRLLYALGAAIIGSVVYVWLNTRDLAAIQDDDYPITGI